MFGKKAEAKKLDPDLPPFPWELEYLWLWFLELSMGLAPNGMGPVMASWPDLRAWSSMMQVDLEPWEARTLIRLSTMRAAIMSEEKPKPKS